MPEDPLLEGFGDLEDPNQPEDDFYPGSKRRKSDEQKKLRERVEKAQKPKNTDWDAHPLRRTVRIHNKPVSMDFFTIGALAKALGKKPVTIRSWISKGWLPKARYRGPAAMGTRGNAGKRLWSRTQIEAIVRIATEENLLGEWTPDIGGSKFPQRVREYFDKEING